MWTECSVSCGKGVITRGRTCIDGVKGQFGCDGDDFNTVDCVRGDCAYYDAWSSWGMCSQSCGGGVRSHVRRCVNGMAGEVGCSDPAMEIESCNNQVE